MPSTGALVLFAGIKARQSPIWGLWWRANTWLSQGQERRIVLVLLGGFVAYRVVHGVALAEGQAMTADVVNVAWLALCVYSWVAPAVFRRRLDREIGGVALRDDF